MSRPVPPSLPGDVAEHLTAMWAVKVDGYRHTDETRRYVRALHEAGWPMSAIAAPLGVTRQYVSLLIRARTLPGPLPAVPPPPPPPPPPVKPPRPGPPDITAAQAEHLRALHVLARTVNGATPLDSAERAATVELSRLLAEYNAAGVSVYRLAQHLRVRHGAVLMRLARHGYRAPHPRFRDVAYRAVRSLGGYEPRPPIPEAFADTLRREWARCEPQRGHGPGGPEPGLPVDAAHARCRVPRRGEGHRRVRRRRARRSPRAARRGHAVSAAGPRRPAVTAVLMVLLGVGIVAATVGGALYLATHPDAVYAHSPGHPSTLCWVASTVLLLVAWLGPPVIIRGVVARREAHGRAAGDQ